MATMFRLGDFEIFWLKGGAFQLDGGGMFGVVPRVLWTKKYPADEENYVTLVTNPLLVKTPQALVLIESGIGNKLNEKQRAIFRVKEEWRVPEELGRLGLRREDVDAVILTHFDWDHASGVVMRNAAGAPELTFPRARHVLQKAEWEDVLAPNRRSAHTYWPANYEALRDGGVIDLVEGEREVVPGITVVRTGGHNRGHQIVLLESRGSWALHLGDLLPVHAQFNPLWITAYDNFPLDSIREKERWVTEGVKDGAWFVFYHDPFMAGCRFDDKGNVLERIEWK